MATLYKISECDHFFSYKNNETLDINNIECNRNEHSIYINGVSLHNILLDNTSFLELKSGDDNVLYIHFESKEYSSITLHTSEQEYKVECNINTSSYDEMYKCDKLIDDDTSFQIIRVNPKLTGNVKVVVDSNNNMYMDTFKVSKGLSQRKYRKVKINPDEYYGKSVMATMSGLSSDDFYKIEDSCYSLFSSVNNVGDEYYDIYNYGVRTNNDKLYNENFSLLAPICIKRKLPDFFVIFKCKNLPEFTSNESRFKYMIENGTIIKSYDMREHSNLGKYIRNIYDKSSKFPGYMFVSYDYDNNTIYNGISLDRGVIATHYESTSTERTIKNQVALNDWYTLGFERNRILSKDIINLEFLFDDQEEELFSINNYFGLYIRLNGEEKDFSCIGTNGSKYIFDANINGSDFVPAETKSVIYGFSTPNSFIRSLVNIENISNENKIQKYALRPYKSIFTSNNVEYKKGISYISCKMSNKFNIGEHYRIIDNIDHNIYDVFFSDYISMYDMSEIQHQEKIINGETYHIHHISIYNTNDKSQLEHLIKLLVDAFNSFNTIDIHAYTDNIDTFSITMDKLVVNENDNIPNILFEKVSNLHNIEDKNNLIYTENCVILNNHTQNTHEYITLSPNSSTTLIQLLYPIGFESLGERYCQCTSFVPSSTDDETLYMFKDDPSELSSNYNSILYQNTKGEYRALYPVSKDTHAIRLIYNDNNDITTTNIKNTYGINGFGTSKTYCMFFPTNNKPITDDGKIRLYQNYPINAGVCSIFPIKDYEHTIYDTNSDFSLNPSDGKVSNKGGIYTSNDNILNTSILKGQEEYICDYIDKNERFKNERFTSLNRNDTYNQYIKTLLENNHNKSDICLTVPYCCKWQSIGTDHTGNFTRIMYPFIDSKYTSLESNNKSYYIPSDASIGIGLLCTNTHTNKNPEKYANDILFDKNYRDYILYGNGAIEDTLYFKGTYNTNKFTRVYSHGNNTLEFIYGGIKIQLTTINNDIVDLSKYHNYEIVLLCAPGNNPSHKNSSEIIIDEINKQIALIYYNGTQSSNVTYNDRTIITSENTNTDINISHVLSIPYNSALSDTKISSLNEKIIAIPDGGGYYNKAVLSNDDNALIVLSSPIKNQRAYTKDKYNVIFCEAIDDKPYNDNFEDYILGKNVIGVTDSSIIENVTNGTIQKHFYKLNDSVDVFIYNDSSTFRSSQINDIIQPKFIDLSKLLSTNDDISITIKTQNGTFDYSSTPGTITMNVISPIFTHREDTDFNTTSLKTNVHSTYTNPLFKDVLLFNFEHDEINKVFKKDFNGCNIKVDDSIKIHNIDNIWMRKYMTNTNEYTNGFVDSTSNKKFKVSSDSVLFDINAGDYFVNNTKDGTYQVYDVITEKINKYQHKLEYTSSAFKGTENELPKKGSVISCGDIKYIVDETDIKIDPNNSTLNGTLTISTLYNDDNIHNKQLSDITLKISQYYIKDVQTITQSQYKKHTVLFEQPSNKTYPTTKGKFTKLNTEYSFTYNSYETTIKNTPNKLNFTTTLTQYKDFSPFKSCFEHDMYRTFLTLDTYKSENGIDTGYEKNTFFGSRGIQLKTGEIDNTITIKDWTKTTLDKNKKRIRLNVTESLINYITFHPGFKSNWTSFENIKSFNKTKYIKNSILKYIDITSSCTFKLYYAKNSKYFDFIDINDRELIEIPNITNRLYKENDTYYIDIEDLGEHTYTATLTIKI